MSSTRKHSIFGSNQADRLIRIQNSSSLCILDPLERIEQCRNRRKQENVHVIACLHHGNGVDKMLTCVAER